jgi:hypothetical protein
MERLTLSVDHESMNDLHALKLVALASKADEPLVPPLEQVVIFSSMLGYICELKLQHLPEEPFKRLPCPSPDQDLDTGIEKNGIDFLGHYEHQLNDITVTLYVCRIMKFCARHGFQREDAIKIVLIHELAHFVTHVGMSNSGAYWEDFWKPDSGEKEELAQEATHLLLRVAGYVHLVNVFDSLSYLCPAEYNAWRGRWKQEKNKNNFEEILKALKARILTLRPPSIEVEDQHEFSGYEEGAAR